QTGALEHRGPQDYASAFKERHSAIWVGSGTRMFRLHHLSTALVFAVAATLAGCGPSGGGGDPVKRGEYLVAVASCSDCHTPGALLGKPQMDKLYSGSDVGFQIPELGVAYPPNLTPDNDTGLGKWSEEEIVNVIRTGK